MYFWKIEKLKRILAKGPLPQDVIFKYLIYFFFLTWIESLLASGSGWTPPISKWIEALVILISNLLEVYASYRFNGGRHGNDFLGRYFPIKLLTTLRFFIFAWLISCLLLIPLCWNYDGIAECLKAKPLYGIILNYSVVVFLSLIRPLRVIFHMRSIRKIEVNKQSLM